MKQYVVSITLPAALKDSPYAKAWVEGAETVINSENVVEDVQKKMTKMLLNAAVTDKPIIIRIEL